MPSISSTLLREVIRARGWHTEPDAEGDYMIRFKPDDTHGCADIALIGIEGDPRNIFSVRMSIDKYFPLDEWKRILMVVNDFNRDCRWPTAFVRFPQSEDQQTVDVECDYFVRCDGPVTREMLDSWITATIVGTDRLFEMLIVENGISPK